MEMLLNQRVPLQVFTDSKTLFDVIVRVSTTSKRRLMIDIHATREAYDRQEITDIGLVRSQYNLADCMTKIMLPKQMIQVMRTSKLSHPVEQFVLRRADDLQRQEMCFVDRKAECRNITYSLAEKDPSCYSSNKATNNEIGLQGTTSDYHRITVINMHNKGQIHHHYLT